MNPNWPGNKPAGSGFLEKGEKFPFNVTITEVPEPATMALLGLGTLALLRKRK